jgi:hypothetical protein
MGSDLRREDEKTVLRGKIENAVFHSEQGQIVVVLSLPDGTKRSAVIHKSSISFGGLPSSSVPEDEVNRQMSRTAEMFRRRRGSSINLEIFTHQL